MIHALGCRFPVSSADFWLCLRKFCGEADRGRLAGQWREFKTYRKSTAQFMPITLVHHAVNDKTASLTVSRYYVTCVQKKVIEWLLVGMHPDGAGVQTRGRCLQRTRMQQN